MSQSETTSRRNDLEMADLSKFDPSTTPKKIDLQINTKKEHEHKPTSLSTSASTPSLPSIGSSLSSSSSSSASSSEIDLDDTLLSPLNLSPRSTPHFNIKSSTKQKPRSNSEGDLSIEDEYEDQRSASQPPLLEYPHNPSPFSISTFLRNEIEYIDIATTPNTAHISSNAKISENKHFNFKNGINKTANINLNNIEGPHSAEQRIYNFFLLFFTMEKLLFFGFWICCDSFLTIITILPTRVLHRIYMKLSYFIMNESMLLYHNFVRYYALYYYYTFNACIIHWISLIKKVFLFICLCRKDVTHDTQYTMLATHNDNNTDINDEYMQYFDRNYTFCCKLLCILSCCCICNRNVYYNKQYEQKRFRNTLYKNKNKNKINQKHSSNTDSKWLRHLKQYTYNKRMEFIKNNGNKYMYTGRDYLDIIRLCTLILCVHILTHINLSQIYHYIRAQENFKLYVLFKIIVIIEHLLSAFGEDCVEALFNSLNKHKWNSKLKMWKICINLLFYVLYNIIHSLLLYGHLITLNAAMNSPNNTLITILVADNFYELKSTVFRKYQITNVFQMVCSDIVERFTIFLFVTLILLQNLCYLGWDNFDMDEWFMDALQLFLIMIGFEMVVDTMKHGFICKFNNLSIKIYRSFYIRLSMDFTNARRMHEEEFISNDKLFFMDRRLGFASLPKVTLFLRIMWQLSEYSNNHFYVKCTFICILFIILYALKLLLSLIIYCKISISRIPKKDLMEYKQMAKNLAHVRRYALLVKKIPI